MGDTNDNIVESCSHDLVMDENGELITRNSNKEVLLCNRKTQACMYVPITDHILKIFGIHIKEQVAHNSLYNNTEFSPEQESLDSPVNSKWSAKATLRLINLYKKYEKGILSTSVRNDTVYQKISTDLAAEGFGFTSTQCRDKFKYLKMRYMKVIDTRKRSGAGTLSFDYFEQMDELFGTKANAVPLAIASSSRPNNSPRVETEENTDIFLEIPKSDSEHSDSPKKKRKVIEKQELSERQHQEKLMMQQKAIDSFEKMMNKLIDKL